MGAGKRVIKRIEIEKNSILILVMVMKLYIIVVTIRKLFFRISDFKQKMNRKSKADGQVNE